MRKSSYGMVALLLAAGLAQAQIMPYPLSLSRPPLPPESTPAGQPGQFPTSGTAFTELPAPSAFVNGDSHQAAPAAPSYPVPVEVNPGPVSTVLFAAPDQVTKFDPTHVQVQHLKHRWVLTSGTVVLKDFGTREQDAHDAVRLVETMKLDEIARVGSPAPIMEFWLSQGAAPALPFGTHHVVPLDPVNLKVDLDKNVGFWSLHNKTQVLCNLGHNEDDARRVLQVIHEHGFTDLIRVGQAGSNMWVFARRENGWPLGHMANSGATAPGSNIRQVSHLETATPAPSPTTSDFSRTTPALAQQSVTRPTPPPQATETAASLTRLPFDFRRAQVRKDGDEWTITLGSQVLASFGNNEQDALKAFNVLSRYQLNELYRIGGPKSEFTFYLSKGEAPRGIPFGVRSYVLDPGHLIIRQESNSFVLADQEQAFWRFGQLAEAQEAVATIKKYEFDHVCHIGNGEGTGLTYLVRMR